MSNNCCNSHNHDIENNNFHSHHHCHAHHGVGKKLFFTMMLNFLITIAEIIGGLLSGSIALLSDAFHNFSDALSQIISFIAFKVAQKENQYNYTYGFKRAEIIAAILNASIITAISLYMIYEAIVRFFHPESIKTNLMMVIAFIGLIANAFSVFLLEKDSHSNINIKSTYLHLLSDAISSLAVIIGGIIIYFSGWNWIDSLLTIFISLYILKEGFNIVAKTTRILLQGTPDGINLDSIKDTLQNIEQVKNIHHLHVWQLNENDIYLECHVVLDDMLLSKTNAIYSKIAQNLNNKFNITHVNIQFEAFEFSCENNNLVYKNCNK